MKNLKGPLSSIYIKIFNITSTAVATTALYLSTLYYYIPNQKTMLYISLCQTFFILEILNIKIGVTNSTIIPTVSQLTSRLFIIWYVCYFQGMQNKISIPDNYKIHFCVMGFAWFISDMIRYVFYTFRFAFARWLRYNLFIVLYPIGIAMEIYLTSRVISNKIGLSIFFSFWLFGFAFLYSHMIRQRIFVNKRTSARKVKKNK